MLDFCDWARRCKYLVILCILLSSHYGEASRSRQIATENLPPKAQQMLETFPEKKVTLPLVIGQAIKSSDSFKAVLADLPQIEVSYLRSQSPYDFSLEAELERRISKNEPQTQFSSSSSHGTALSLRTSKYFSTGTSLSAEVSHGSTAIGFQSFSGISFYETKGTFQVSQNLWKDAFGSANRRSLKAGGRLKEAEKERFQESVENWVAALVKFYYRAWFDQTRVFSAQEGLERRNRLLQTTRIKLQRGTSEKPDLLQVQSAKIQSEVELSQSQQVLNQTWRELVLSLGFPKDWIHIDPILIPMKLDDPILEATRLCGGSKRPNEGPNHSSTTRKLDFQAEASKLLAEKNLNLAKPTLSLNLGLISNGIDDDSSPTFPEFYQIKHPAWSIGLVFSVPFSHSAELAEAHESLSNQIRSEALASQAKTDLQTQWINGCTAFQRWVTSTRLLQTAYEHQQERLRLEERRFRIGRAPTINVIQAGDDATRSELDLRNAEMESRISAWEVRKLAGKIEGYLKEIGFNPDPETLMRQKDLN